MKNVGRCKPTHFDAACFDTIILSDVLRHMPEPEPELVAKAFSKLPWIGPTLAMLAQAVVSPP